MELSLDKNRCWKGLEIEGVSRVALIHHLKISDSNGYAEWLQESQLRFGCKRLFRVKVDPVAREGMLIDEIVIDEYGSSEEALKSLSSFKETLDHVCCEHVVLVVRPEPAATFLLVKIMSGIIRFFKGITDKDIPTLTWKAKNDAVWPDSNQMEIARAEDHNEPLFVYNLNKYRAVAEYEDSAEAGKKISGEKAYNRYSKIVGIELLRRGAYPVYGGKPLCLLGGDESCMLVDSWDHFIFVRYPQRRNLLTMIESEEFHNGEIHRDAGLERVAIFMAKGV